MLWPRSWAFRILYAVMLALAFLLVGGAVQWVLSFPTTRAWAGVIAGGLVVALLLGWRVTQPRRLVASSTHEKADASE